MTQFKLGATRVVFYVICIVLFSFSSVEGSTECDVFGTCSQGCTDTGNGYHQCSCTEGFLLAQDHRTCNPIGITSLTGANESSRTIYRRSLNSQAAEEIETVADTGIYDPSAMAFDWITGNIYLVDSNRSHIVVCASATGDCAVVFQGQDKKDTLRFIALHPNQRIMFWTSWGDKHSISRAGMDGALLQIIVSADIIMPLGIAIDQGSSRIFWAETHLGGIQSCRFDGSDRRIFSAAIHPGTVSVFGDRIFWDEWLSGEILSANKYYGSNKQVHFSLSSAVLYDLDVFHIANQPIYISNPCVRAQNCSHICTLSQAETKFRCFCPIGMMLLDDNMTCVEQQEVRKLVIAFGGTIKSMKFNTIGKTKFESITFPNIKAISAIVYNPINHTLIFSNAGSKRIYEYSISTKEVNVLIDKHLDFVIGMDIDVVGQNLYWIDSGKQTIEAMEFRTGGRSVVKAGVEQAVDILIVQKMGISEGGGRIDKMFLNGDGMSIFQTFQEEQPIALSYDKESGNILWVDSVSRSVQSNSLDGNSSFSLVVSQHSLPSDVAKFGSKVFWPDISSQQLKFKWMGSNKTHSVIMGTFDGNSSHFANGTNLQAKMTIINRNLSDLQEVLSGHECSKLNPSRKQCSHLCLLTREKLVGECRCPEGFTLDRIGVTCNQTLTCDRDQFSCKNGPCISRNSICDGVSDCRHGEDEVQCDVTPCPGGRFKCPIDGVCIPQDWVCDKDVDCEGGGDERNCSTRRCQTDLEFKCESSGRCISSARRCNGAVDCLDQSDELNCNNSTCPLGSFKCLTLFECIDVNWVCDGDSDCDDRSDEISAVCASVQQATCSPQQFTCNNGRCIDKSLKCDGRSNCANNEDEMNCESLRQQTTRKEDTTITTEKFVKKYDMIVTTDKNVHGDNVFDTTVVAPAKENASKSGDEDDDNWKTYVIVICLMIIIILVVVVIALVLSKMKRGGMTLEFTFRCSITESNK